MKFGRKHKLIFEFDTSTTTQNAIEITTPLTVEFDVTRNTSSSLNSASFRIYNLSATNRNLVFQNRIGIKDINGRRKRVIFQAGYNSLSNIINKEGDLSTIFIGDLLEAYSYRQGADIITYINAQDGGFGAYNSIVNVTLDKNTSLKDSFTAVASSIKGVKLGAVGEILGSHKTPTPFNGNAFALLSRDYKDQVFIDLEKINKLNPNEYLKGQGGVPLITSESGLLGTPLVQGAELVVEMLFEPRINVGQLVEIKSSINPKFDGQYKVNGVKHAGVISDAVSGNCRTVLNLFIGDKLLGDLKEVS